jgi:hypothetical protein
MIVNLPSNYFLISPTKETIQIDLVFQGETQFFRALIQTTQKIYQEV